MADDVTYGAGNNATPPNNTIAATDETTSGPHSAGAQMGIAKLAVSANGDSTHVPATAADGLLVNLGANNDVTVTGSVTTGGLTDAELRATPVPVTANAGTNLNTSALALEAGGNLAAAAASLATLDNIVSGSEAQVDIVASLPAGTNNIGDVDVLTMPVTEVVGDVAADAAVPANPLAVGGRSSDALPTEVSADGDSVYLWLLRNGALMSAQLPHLGLLGDPYTITSETAQYTTTQTSTALVSPGGGQRVAVTSIQIQAGGTTAGALQVYFGDGAYSRGTSLAIFDGEFAPSATLKPGFALAPYKPWIGGADEELRVTDSAAINPLTVTVWYYLI